MSTWIDFVESQPDARRVTSIWIVLAKEGGGTLGQVRWYSGWRRYCFFPQPQTTFEPTCLRDIANWCENRTLEHKAKKQEKA